MIMQSNKGFSLTEAMVSVAIFAFVMTGLYTSLYAGHASFEIQSASLIAQKEARNAIVELTRELRMVSGISLTQTSDDVTLVYTDPIEGTVTYSWTNDQSSSAANQLVRTTATSTRIVAQNISALVFTDNTSNIVVNITATSDVQMGGAGTESFTLVKKIGIR